MRCNMGPSGSLDCCNASEEKKIAIKHPYRHCHKSVTPTLTQHSSLKTTGTPTEAIDADSREKNRSRLVAYLTDKKIQQMDKEAEDRLRTEHMLLENLDVTGLKHICINSGLSLHGSKSELLERIIEHRSQ